MSGNTSCNGDEGGVQAAPDASPRLVDVTSTLCFRDAAVEGAADVRGHFAVRRDAEGTHVAIRRGGTYDVAVMGVRAHEATPLIVAVRTLGGCTLRYVLHGGHPSFLDLKPGYELRFMHPDYSTWLHRAWVLLARWADPDDPLEALRAVWRA